MNDVSYKVKYNNVYHDVYKEITPESKIGVPYLVNNDVYIYQGCISNSESLHENSEGLYYDLYNEEYFAVGNPISTINDLIVQDTTPDIQKLINKIKKLDIKKPVKPKKRLIIKANLSSENKTSKKTEMRRMDKDEPMYFEISSNDELLVQIVKDFINSHEIYYSDLEDYVFRNNLNGEEKSTKTEYNLFYGLKHRNTMTWEIFELWCDILKIDVTMTIKEREKEE